MNNNKELPEDKLLEFEAELKKSEKSPLRKFAFTIITIGFYMVRILYYNGRDENMVRFFALMTILMLCVLCSKIDNLNKKKP